MYHHLYRVTKFFFYNLLLKWYVLLFSFDPLRKNLDFYNHLIVRVMAGYFMNIERRYFLELFYGKSTIVFYLFFFFIHYILSRNNKDNYQANFYIEYNLRYNVHNLWIIIVLLLWRPVAHEKPIHMIFERLTIMSPSDEHKISFRLLLMV